MIVKKKKFLQSQFLSTEFLINKFFVKYIYTKFFCIATIPLKKKRLIVVDNYLNEFTLKIKKKFKRLQHFFKLKLGSSFKSDLFAFKHSKLKIFMFISVKFKSYLKKNLTNCLNSLKTLNQPLNTLFLYKSIRGGFLGFSNKLCGYISKTVLAHSKIKILKYKKYCIVHHFSTTPYFLANYKNFYFYNVGFLRNFRKVTFNLKHFFFKRFKVIFSLFSLFSKYLINQIFLIFFRIPIFKQINILKFFDNAFYTLFRIFIS